MAIPEDHARAMAESDPSVMTPPGDGPYWSYITQPSGDIKLTPLPDHGLRRGLDLAMRLIREGYEEDHLILEILELLEGAKDGDGAT